MSRITGVLNKQIERMRQLTRENGQTLVEYGIIVMLLALAAVSILSILGTDVVDLFTSVSFEFQEIDSRTRDSQPS